MPNDDDQTPPAGSDPAGDAIRRRLTRAADPASDPAGAYDRVVAKRASRRVRRRAGTIALGVAVVAATAGGTFALARVFGGGATPQPAASTSTGFANGLIAFILNDRIVTATPNGSDQRFLTPTSLVASDPAWSPDGSRIAFDASDSGGDPQLTRLYVMGADGHGLHAVVGGGYIEPAWSQDGTSLFFVEHGPGHSLFEVGLNGGPIINVVTLGSGISLPAVSTSGRIAISVSWSHGTQIEVLDPGGTDPTPVPNTKGMPSGASWSPDGSTLVYYVAGSLSTVQPDGSHLHGLAAGNFQHPSYSPDGTKILVQDLNGPGTGYIEAFPVDGGAGTLIPLPAGSALPAWQPVPLASVPSPSASPTRSPATPTPTPSPTPTPTPTPTRSPSPSPPNCDPSSTIQSDFDSDGTQDTAQVMPASCPNGGSGAGQTSPASPAEGWQIEVFWGNGVSGAWPLPECTDDSCAAVGSIPMNDGTNALVLRTHEGASTIFYGLLDLLPGETGPQPYGVVDPGAPGFPAGQTAEFPDVGSVSHQAFFRCQGGPYPGGGDQATIVETTADLSNNQTTYTVTETILAHGPNAGKPELTVVSQTSKEVAFDAFDPANDVVGVPCWGPGSGSPSP